MFTMFLLPSTPQHSSALPSTYLYWPPVLGGRSTALSTVTIISSLVRSYQVFTWNTVRHENTGLGLKLKCFTCNLQPRFLGGDRERAALWPSICSREGLERSSPRRGSDLPSRRPISESLDTTSSIVRSWRDAAMISLTCSRKFFLNAIYFVVCLQIVYLN